MPKKTRLPIWTIFTPSEIEILRTPGVPLTMADIQLPEIQRLIDDMHVTMKQAEGIGLAAPQIGTSLRVTVITQSVDPSLTTALTLINPVISRPSSEQVIIEEGCLSIPGVFGNVQRAERITVRFFDRAGAAQTLTAGGLLARVIQHEVDHLNGVLFIDRDPEFTRGQELLP